MRIINSLSDIGGVFVAEGRTDVFVGDLLGKVCEVGLLHHLLHEFVMDLLLLLLLCLGNGQQLQKLGVFFLKRILDTLEAVEGSLSNNGVGHGEVHGRILKAVTGVEGDVFDLVGDVLLLLLVNVRFLLS